MPLLKSLTFSSFFLFFSLVYFKYLYGEGSVNVSMSVSWSYRWFNPPNMDPGNQTYKRKCVKELLFSSN